MQHNNITLLDKIIAVFSYMTLGFLGMIWFLVNTLIIRKPMSNFLKYNLVQSFIISIILAIATYAYEIISGIVFNLGFIGDIFKMAHIYIFATPIFNTMNFANYILLLFLIYLSVFALFGKLPFVPYITDIAKKIFN